MALKTLSKKVFLDELVSGKGVAEICRDFGMKSTSTVYSWRKRDDTFRDEMAKIMSSPFHKTRIAAATTAKTDDEGWRERFIGKMRDTRDRVISADFAGKSMKFIMEASDPASESYDIRFHDMIYEEELRDAVRIEDEVMRRATVGNSSQAQKFLLPYLPVVGEKYFKGKENRLQSKETNVFIFSPQSMEAAQNQLIDVFGSKKLPAAN